jgi:hypothetical protein
MEASRTLRESAHQYKGAELSGCVGTRGTKLTSAHFTGTDFAKMVEAEDSRRVAVRKYDLDRVVPYRAGGFGCDAGLEHRQQRHRRSAFSGFHFLLPLVVAHRARAGIAQIGKVVMTNVGIRPGDVDPLAGRYVDLQACRFFPGVEWDRHLGLRARSKTLL